MSSTLDAVLQRFGGQPIPHCPGRFVLRRLGRTDGPVVVVGPDLELAEHDPPTAPDHVVVAWTGEWGLISYGRADGSWTHTINTADGFHRKLRDLGIDPVPPAA